MRTPRNASARPDVARVATGHAPLPATVALRVAAALVLAAVALAARPATAAPAPAPAPAQRTTTAATAPLDVQLAVDATDAPRQLFHARLTIPAASGPLTLVYPKWIPGEHSPSGPIENLVVVEVRAGGHALPWRRDPLDMYAIHLDVPAGASGVEVALDFIAPLTGTHSAGASTTDHLCVVSWNQLVLYPAGRASDDVRVRATLRLPPGWRHATALAVARTAAGTVDFAPVTLTTLVDSPVLAGAHMRALPLAAHDPQAPPHTLHLAADSEEALAIPPWQLAAYARLVDEAFALFGARHYRAYHFLVTLSDTVQHFGLEHHESSDNRVDERSLVDDAHRRDHAGLLPHEFVHSWNGKHRRPAGLATPDYQHPMVGDLLWIYEGLTTYLGGVLTARSGLLPPAEAREDLAVALATMEHRPGRRWRSVGDTATSAQVLYSAPPEWASWRRKPDFYPEGALVWLEADALIRQRTGQKRSLDDFCRRFFGGASGPPSVKPYQLDDVIAALDEVAPSDWRAFFAARIDAVVPRAPSGGVEAAGWKLAYDATPNGAIAAYEKARKVVELPFSLGIRVKEDGVLVDVTPGMPAAIAGAAPGMKLHAVDGRRWTPELLHAAVAATPRTKGIDLLLTQGDFFRTVHLRYSGGERSPHLVRDPARPDLLSAIHAPLRPGASGQ